MKTNGTKQSDLARLLLAQTRKTAQETTREAKEQWSGETDRVLEALVKRMESEHVGQVDVAVEKGLERIRSHISGMIAAKIDPVVNVDHQPVASVVNSVGKAIEGLHIEVDMLPVVEALSQNAVMLADAGQALEENREAIKALTDMAERLISSVQAGAGIVAEAVNKSRTRSVTIERDREGRMRSAVVTEDGTTRKRRGRKKT